MIFKITLLTKSGKPYHGSVMLSGKEFLSERCVYMSHIGDGVYVYYGNLFKKGEILEIFPSGYYSEDVRHGAVITIRPWLGLQKRQCHTFSVYDMVNIGS